jgi:glyoxylase-like metal-dependent hydrolase (beta-lactamase superfamily II)
MGDWRLLKRTWNRRRFQLPLGERISVENERKCLNVRRRFDRIGLDSFLFLDTKRALLLAPGGNTMLKRVSSLGLLLLPLLFWLPANAQEDVVMEAGISVKAMNDHLYQMVSTFNEPVNLVVSSGPDGKLLVDAGRTQTIEQLSAALDTLGEGRVKYVISTHSHGDHTGGNQAFGDEVTMIAHENTARRLSGNYFALAPLPGRRTPDLGVTGDFSMTFNGEEIQFIHVPVAHTDGDLMAFFTESRVLFMSDLLFADMIVFSHLDLGGNALNYADNIKTIIDTLPEDITIIPGHGPNYTLDELREYYKMVEFTVERVKEGVARGESVEGILADERLNQWSHWDLPGELTSLERWITDLYQSTSAPDAAPVVSVCEPMTELILAEGIDAAVAWYRETKQSSPDDHNFGVDELNNLGYHLFWRDRLDDAIEVFKLNIEVYPENANAYDSMGEAYMNKGDTELAIENFERSLELNPDNTNATEMLVRLRSEN